MRIKIILGILFLLKTGMVEKFLPFKNYSMRILYLIKVKFVSIKNIILYFSSHVINFYHIPHIVFFFVCEYIFLNILIKLISPLFIKENSSRKFFKKCQTLLISLSFSSLPWKSKLLFIVLNLYILKTLS